VDSCLKVILANRNRGRFWSIEEIFSNVQRCFPSWVQSIIVSAPNGRANFGSLRANLSWLCSLESCDLIHQTGDIHYVILGSWRFPTILTIHDLRLIEESRGIKRFLFLWLWFYLPCLKAKKITVISEFTKGRLLKYCKIDANKIRVIPNCVSPEFVAKKDVWPLDKVKILQVGTTDNKNLFRLAEACSGLSVSLCVLGKLSDHQHERLKRFDIDYKEYVGLTKEDVYNLYVVCNLVVFVSTYEGFGMPIIEAQAIGRPVLTSKIAPMCEVAGKGAFLVDPFSVDSIRSGLERLLNDAELREQLVASGFENVKRFSASAVALEYATLYREVIEGTGR